MRIHRLALFAGASASSSASIHPAASVASGLAFADSHNPCSVAGKSTSHRLPFLGRNKHGAGLADRHTRTNRSLSTMSAILDSPSAERNKDPILEVLRETLHRLVRSTNKTGSFRVLEIAAGCGVHTVHLARGLLEERAVESLLWFPTDPSEDSRQSIDERVWSLGDADSSDNDKRLQRWIIPARSLTLDENGVIEGRGGNGGDGGSGIQSLPDPLADLPESSLDLVININMIHISPWEAAIGLMKTASHLLREGGVLYCYGPYKRNGTAVESNLNFDRSLQSRDSSWGVRDLGDVVSEAKKQGLALVKIIEMPANNLSVIYQKV